MKISSSSISWLNQSLALRIVKNFKTSSWTSHNRNMNKLALCSSKTSRNSLNPVSVILPDVSNLIRSPAEDESESKDSCQLHGLDLSFTQQTLTGRSRGLYTIQISCFQSGVYIIWFLNTFLVSWKVLYIWLKRLIISIILNTIKKSCWTTQGKYNNKKLGTF